MDRFASCARGIIGVRWRCLVLREQQAMTRSEWRILGPLATRLHNELPRIWRSLVYQTQFGPEFPSFPYFPAAIELERPAQELVHGIPPAQKATLLKEWVSQHRLISITPAEAILDRYSAAVVDVLISRAKTAGNRTSSF